MMRDYEFIFANQLRQKMWSKVRGSVKAWVTDDELHISIRNEEYNTLFESVIPNIAEQVLHGLTTDYVLYGVMKQYKEFILNQFIR